MVSRLTDPYSECVDPGDADKMHNAYAEHHPVVYTSQVSTMLYDTIRYDTIPVVKADRYKQLVCCAWPKQKITAKTMVSQVCSFVYLF